MKKALIALCILFVGFNLQAQETDAEKQAKAIELMSIKVDMEVDSSLFTKVTPNTYVSESPKAAIIAMVVPETFESSKIKMNEEMSSKFKISDKGEKMINGVKVLYYVGVGDAQGVTVNISVYCFERDKETCIMFMGMSEEGVDKKYTDAIQAAGNSAIKKY